MGAKIHFTLTAGLAALTLGLAASGADAQPRGGLTRQQEDELSHKHDGFYGALAPQNLNKKRPKAPFNATGTWFINLRKSFGDFMYGPPYPEFLEPGQTAMKESAAARAAGRPYRDTIGEGWPAGIPMIMTRVWPINIIQLPTAIHMIFGFTNSLRIIYLDGRKFSDPDSAIYTYNGESIGHFEGDTLVVHTKYIEPKQHFIDMGIPVSDKFEVTERINLLDKGHTLQIETIMTDPDNWKGEWRHVHRWIRSDYSDVPEVEVTPDLNKHLPSTEKGQEALKEREKASEAPAKP